MDHRNHTCVSNDENEDTSELEGGSQAGAADCLIYEGKVLNIAKLFHDFFYLSHLRFQISTAVPLGSPSTKIASAGRQKSPTQLVT
jgi:hypothetical protein